MVAPKLDVAVTSSRPEIGRQLAGAGKRAAGQLRECLPQGIHQVVVAGRGADVGLETEVLAAEQEALGVGGAERSGHAGHGDWPGEA